MIFMALCTRSRGSDKVLFNPVPEHNMAAITGSHHMLKKFPPVFGLKHAPPFLLQQVLVERRGIEANLV